VALPLTANVYGTTPRQRYNARLQALQNARAPYDVTYRQLGQYLSPWRVRFDESTRGRETNDAILDPTGTRAVNTCTAGISAALVSAARIWFNFGPPVALLARDRAIGQRPQFKRYLTDAADVCRDILLRSNFYGVTSGSVIRDLVVFGINGSFVEEHWRTVASFRPLPIGQYWLAANAQGEIDTIYRRFTYTVAQMVQEFGYQNCSGQVRDQYRRHQLDTEHVIMHVVEPNRRDQETGFEAQRAGRLNWQGMDWRSVWYEHGNDQDNGGTWLRVRGYRDFPALAPRWSRTSAEDVYGTGAGHNALPDVKMLQTLTRRLVQMVDKASAPPLKGSAETSGFPSQLPGAFTRVPAGGTAADKLEPIYVPDRGAIAEVRAERAQTQQFVKEGLHADMWRILSDDTRAQPPTAEEVREIKAEKLQILSPITQSIEGEYLRRALDRVFALAERAGMLPDPPAELEGEDLKVDFISIFGEAQKAQQIPTLERVAAFVKALAELDEEVLDDLDADKFAAKYAEVASLPPDLLRSPEAVKAIRAARAEKRQAQELGQAMAVGAKATKDAAGATLENDNALTRLLGTLGPAAASQATAGVPAAVPLGAAA
jgi:hypothetical protein